MYVTVGGPYVEASNSRGLRTRSWQMYRCRRLESDKELPQVFSRVESLNDFSSCVCQHHDDESEIDDVNAVCYTLRFVFCCIASIVSIKLCPKNDHLFIFFNNSVKRKLGYRRGTARRAMSVEILSTAAQL